MICYFIIGIIVLGIFFISWVKEAIKIKDKEKRKNEIQLIVICYVATLVASGLTVLGFSLM